MEKLRLRDYLFNGAIAVIISIPICVSAYNSRNPVEETYEPVIEYTEPSEDLDPGVTDIVIDIITDPETEIETETEEEIEYISLGTFRITAYCSCKKCCGKWADSRPLDKDGNPIVYGASGAVLIPEYSVAVDPKVIPYGTKLYFNGNEYIAHDCGGAIKGNDLDLYFDSHEDALNWGVKKYEVFIVKVD